MVSISVHLSNSKWESTDHGETYVRGNAFQDSLLQGNEILEKAHNTNNKDEIIDLIESLNGFFSIIHRIRGTLVLSVDQIQSIPLFYARTDSEVLISDDAHWIQSELDIDTYDLPAATEYVLTGYVTGRDTLCTQIHQVTAGEIILIDISDTPNIESHFHTDYLNENKNERIEDPIIEYNRVIESVTSRLVKYAAGRPIVISMSGGYDSRLIATMLRYQKYEDIIALTYTYQSDEDKLARKAAEELGIKHVHIDQSHQECYNWYHSDERQKFDRVSGYLHAYPTINEALVIKKAREKEKIPEDAVIVTGDTASTTGEHIPYSLYETRNPDYDDLIKEILDFHYTLWPWHPDIETTLSECVKNSIIEDTSGDKYKTAKEFERWDWRERQAKHILRTHIFDFYNFDWWLPLWDKEYMEFWADIPLNLRYNRSLHEEFVEQLYADVTGLSSDEASKSFHKQDKWVALIEDLVTGTPLESVANDLYQQYISPREYDHNPLFGIMSEEQFNDLMSTKQTIHSYRVLNILDLVSFVPRSDAGYPTNGVVDRDWVKYTLFHYVTD